jgi:hypothetical protein
MKKGILINVNDKSFTEVEVGEYTDIYKHLGCELFDVVNVDENNDVYVDEEGLLNLTPESKFFVIDGFPQPLCGHGLVLGIDQETGDSVNTSIKIDELKKMVTFMDIFEVQRKFS